MSGKRICFHLDGNHYELTRLTDKEYRERHRVSLAIADDYRFYLQLYFSLESRNERLTFGELYVALKRLSGESGRCFDRWKSSFSFPFSVAVQRREESFAYLLNVRNFRDSFYFSFRKVLSSRNNQYDR